MKINEIFKKFVIDTRLVEYGDGHINDTYLSESEDYILQKINTNIFTDPEALMENISNVTDYLREKIMLAGGDPDRETLTVIKTHDGKKYYESENKEAYRVYKFIKKSKSISEVSDPEQLYQAAKGFGSFTQMLAEYPAESLAETIPDFHNTPKRFEALKKAIEEDRVGRAESVKAEIDFAIKNSDFISVVTDGIADGSIPLRVTHNDTKINNVLFDETTGEPVCVIDLDTVMPGSLLYDFGDALRIGAATAAEDEKDLSKVWFDMQAFKCFCKGYFEKMGKSMTEREIELLPVSAKLLTYECGIRFLTDYLNGDTYFKIHRPEHNLDRARTQFKLVSDIDKKMEEMIWAVKKVRESIDN